MTENNFEIVEKKAKENKFDFSKTILLPFVSGILGTA